MTLLLCACKYACFENIKLAIDQSNSVNICNKNGESALKLLCKYPCQEADLIDKGLDSKFKDKNGMFPIHHICNYFEDIRVISKIIDLTTDLECQD